MTLGFKPRGSEFIDWNSTLHFVIPAQAGIQSLVNKPKLNLDAGLRRHDKSSLRLKARDFNHPRNEHSGFFFAFIAPLRLDSGHALREEYLSEVLGSEICSGSVRSRSLTSFEMTNRLFCCHFERSEKSFTGWKRLLDSN